MRPIVVLVRRSGALPCKLLFDGFGYPGVTRHVAGPRHAGRIDVVKCLRLQAQVDAIQTPNSGGLARITHGATLAPFRRLVEYVSVSFLLLILSMARVSEGSAREQNR